MAIVLAAIFDNKTVYNSHNLSMRPAVNTILYKLYKYFTFEYTVQVANTMMSNYLVGLLYFISIQYLRDKHNIAPKSFNALCTLCVYFIDLVMFCNT